MEAANEVGLVRLVAAVAASLAAPRGWRAAEAPKARSDTAWCVGHTACARAHCLPSA